LRCTAYRKCNKKYFYSIDVNSAKDEGEPQVTNRLPIAQIGRNYGASLVADDVTFQLVISGMTYLLKTLS
jgi:hypothetical protein